MKTIIKQGIIWGSALIVSSSTAFFITYDFSSVDEDNNVTTYKEETPQEEKVLSPQQLFLNNLISIKGASLEGNISVSNDDINASIDVNGDFLIDIEDIASTSFQGSFLLNVNDINLEGVLTYINERIFVEYNNSKLYLETSSILDFISMIPSYGVSLSLPNELSELDYNGLLEEITSMECEESDEGYVFTFKLSEDIVLYLKSDDQYNFIGVSSNLINFNGMNLSLNFELNTNEVESIIIEEPSVLEYASFNKLFNLFDAFYNTFKSKTNTLNLKIDIDKDYEDYLSLNTDVTYDLDNYVFALDGKVIEETYNRSHNFLLGYQEESLFVNYNSLKLRIDETTLIELIEYVLNKVGNETLEDALSSYIDLTNEINVEDILSNLNSINRLIESISMGETTLDVSLNLDQFDLDIGKLELSFLKDDNELVSLNIKGLNLSGYQVDISLSSLPYEPISFSKEDYEDIEPALSLIDWGESIVNETRFNIGIEGKVTSLDSLVNDITFDSYIQFDLEGEYGYGELNLVDRDAYSHNLFIDMIDYDNVLFVYNNSLKGKFTSYCFEDIYSLASRIMNNKDEGIYEIIDGLMLDSITFPIVDIINEGDYGKLFEIGLIESLSIDTSGIYMTVIGDLLGLDSNFDLTILYDLNSADKANILKSVEVNNLILGNNIYDLKVSLSDYDEALDENRLNVNDDYLDFDSLSVLLALGINNANYSSYHLNGSVTLSILGLYSMTVPIDIKIVRDGAYVDALITMDVPIASLVNSGYDGHDNVRTSYILYSDGYFYIYRQETYTTGYNWAWIYDTREYWLYEKYAKTDTSDFLDNFTYYFCDIALGINSTWLDMIYDSEEDNSDHTIQYENIIVDYSHYDSETNPYFYVVLSMSELSGSSVLGDLALTVYYDKENELLTSISLNMKMVSVITMTGSIAQVNIGQDGDLDISFLYKYIEKHIDDTLYQTYEEVTKTG